MPSAHEFRPHIHVPAGYRLHEWRCTCGARSRTRRTRSLLLCELDWWSDHVLPGVTPPAHTPTLEEGEFGPEMLTWVCSCGDRGEPAGYSTERWAWQSHRRHEHQRTREWFMAYLRQQLDNLPAEEWQAYQRTLVEQRMEADEQERHRPLHPEVVKEILDNLI